MKEKFKNLSDIKWTLLKGATITILWTLIWYMGWHLPVFYLLGAGLRFLGEIPGMLILFGLLLVVCFQFLKTRETVDELFLAALSLLLLDFLLQMLVDPMGRFLWHFSWIPVVEVLLIWVLKLVLKFGPKTSE